MCVSIIIIIIIIIKSRGLVLVLVVRLEDAAEVQGLACYAILYNYPSKAP